MSLSFEEFAIEKFAVFFVVRFALSICPMLLTHLPVAVLESRPTLYYSHKQEDSLQTQNGTVQPAVP